MSKINLKSLENTVVHTPTEAEFKELMQFYEAANMQRDQAIHKAVDLANKKMNMEKKS